MRGAGTLVLVTVLLLSGCTQEPPAAPLPTQGGEPHAPAAVATEETGSLAGIVVNQELQPLPEAEIGILDPPGPKTRTAADGTFTFNGLAAGSIAVGAIAPGYEPFLGRFVIEVGLVKEARIHLVAIPARVPYADSWEHAGYYELSVGTPVISPRPSTPGGSTWGGKHDIFDGLNASVSSVVWKSSAAFSASRFRLVIDTNGDNKFDQAGPSPLIAHVSDYNGTKPGFIRNEVLVPVTCGCATNPPNGLIDPVVGQRFVIYGTAFYHDAAPDGFTNAPDG